MSWSSSFRSHKHFKLVKFIAIITESMVPNWYLVRRGYDEAAARPSAHEPVHLQLRVVEVEDGESHKEFVIPAVATENHLNKYQCIILQYNNGEQ